MSTTLPDDDAAIFEMIGTHARSIGLLCIYMASLDNAITRLIERLLGVDEKVAACVSPASMDISTRCEMAIRLVMLKFPSGAWRSSLLEC